MNKEEFLKLEIKIGNAFENLEDYLNEFGLKKEKMDYCLNLLWSEYQFLLKTIDDEMVVNDE